MEPWDGPAGLVFTDGLGVGAALDRNGLRPLRYAVCDDGLVACCSEAGAVDVSGHGQVTPRPPRPGPDAVRRPHPRLPRRPRLQGAARPPAGPTPAGRPTACATCSRGRPIEQTPEPDVLERRQAMFGYTKEELAMVLRPMANDAKEPTFSMGDDSPLPHLAGRPRPIHHYLKQRFAQVTNPPIDHLRERLVMSLRTLLGPPQPHPHRGPGGDPRCWRSSRSSSTRRRSSTCWRPTPASAAPTSTPPSPPPTGPAGCGPPSSRLCDEAEQLVRGGRRHPRHRRRRRRRRPGPGARPAGHRRRPPPPRGRGLRTDTSLVVSADDARDVHYIACLLGYGADAICPGLALETVAHEADQNADTELSGPEAQHRLQAAMEDGVLKVMSKMGISTVDSYRGAQIFEVIGLGPEVVDVCFTGTPSIVGGIGWDELGEDALPATARAAWSTPASTGSASRASTTPTTTRWSRPSTR